MMKMICFDMDGTIADLYGVENWLDMLRAEDVTPYAEAAPMHDMARLAEVCALLQKAGWEIRIITALSKGASPEYKKAIRAAKKAWLDKWGFVYDHFHGIDYNAKKQNAIRRAMGCSPCTYQMVRRFGNMSDILPEAILIDDEERHTKAWQYGRTISPSANLIENLLALLPAELLED